MSQIKELRARQILDSRGTPTVEVDCTLSNGSFGRAAVPSGASTGTHEALELRDGDKKFYNGKSVRTAVENVSNRIAPALLGKDVSDQRAIDQLLIDLDGSSNKVNLGANAILGVSMAVCRARAESEKKPLFESLTAQFGVKEGKKMVLPVPLMNVINGGKHADSGLSFQECMIVPADFPSFSEALRAGVEVFQALKSLLSKAGHVTAVGDEGGFAPHVRTAAEAFDFLMQAIEAAGYTGKVTLAIDAAASEFSQQASLPADGAVGAGKWTYTVDGRVFSSEELVDYYADLCSKYPLVSIEDSHSEDDWGGFATMKKKVGKKVQLVGDDIFCTSVARVEEGIQKDAANAVLIKVNQIGTVTETVDCIQRAQKEGWNTIVSHRSGETEDTFISHLAVGLQTGQIKTGSLSRSDRVCKYNELLRIEEILGEKAGYVSPF